MNKNRYYITGKKNCLEYFYIFLGSANLRKNLYSQDSAKGNILKMSFGFLIKVVELGSY